MAATLAAAEAAGLLVAAMAAAATAGAPENAGTGTCDDHSTRSRATGRLQGVRGTNPPGLRNPGRRSCHRAPIGGLESSPSGLQVPSCGRKSCSRPAIGPSPPSGPGPSGTGRGLSIIHFPFVVGINWQCIHSRAHPRCTRACRPLLRIAPRSNQHGPSPRVYSNCSLDWGQSTLYGSTRHGWPHFAPGGARPSRSRYSTCPGSGSRSCWSMTTGVAVREPCWCACGRKRSPGAYVALHAAITHDLEALARAYGNSRRAHMKTK